MDVGSPKWRRLLQDGLASLGLAVDEAQLDRMALHAAELIRWNRKINLTAITEPGQVAVKHFIDSAAALPWIPPGARLLDIGSGGGFPGVPLKLLDPSLRVLLIDAVRKKVSFLSHLIRLLSLEGIAARHIRAEDLAVEEAGGFDVIVCRALTDVERFAALALPLLGGKGRLIAFQGQGGQDGAGPEFPAGLRVQRTGYLLPPEGLKRSLLVLERD